jgi:hypothetical protein
LLPKTWAQTLLYNTVDILQRMLVFFSPLSQTLYELLVHASSKAIMSCHIFVQLQLLLFDQGSFRGFLFHDQDVSLFFMFFFHSIYVIGL